MKSVLVELECRTAAALKKTVLLCLIDSEPLPLSLAAIEAVGLRDVPLATQRILAGLGHDAEKADQLRQQKVIDQLAGMEDLPDSEVLQKARATFEQNQCTVQGSVYQASGDLLITNPQPQKTGLDKWQARATIVGVVAAIVFGAVQLVRSSAPTPKDPRVQQAVPSEEQRLAGSIWDDAGEPLAGVKVSMFLNDTLLASGETDSLGRFSFRTTAPVEAEVTIVGQRAGYLTEKRYTELGNPAFNFKMRRVQ